jgi:hypothetical protein
MRYGLLLALVACASPTPESTPTVRRTRVPETPDLGVDIRKFKEQLRVPEPFHDYISAPDDTTLREVTSPIASVGMIMRGAPAGAADQHCTGTLIACDAVLTARHCIHENKIVTSALIPNEQLFVFFPVAGVRGVINKMEAPTNDPAADLAVLYLDESVDLPLVPLDLDGMTRSGDGRVCGFGYGRWNLPPGLRRIANVSYFDCSPDICWYYRAGNHDQGTTCAGDSGGPLYDSSSRQIGLHSGSETYVCGRSDKGRDVKLSRYKTLIDSWRKHRECAVDWKTWGESGNGQDVWSLHIDESTSVVRIGADGEFPDFNNKPRDLRLVVSGNDGTILCDEHPANAWAFCELKDLPSGDYVVNPTRASTLHQYQLSFGAR